MIPATIDLLITLAFAVVVIILLASLVMAQKEIAELRLLYIKAGNAWPPTPLNVPRPPDPPPALTRMN